MTHDRLRHGGARLLTLTGAGGSGKSRLAARVASDLMHEFRDGARYVELAPVAHTDDVLPAIARALGVARPDAASVRMADTIEAVRDREQLLVVDNFEHLLVLCSAHLCVAARLSGPGHHRDVSGVAAAVRRARDDRRAIGGAASGSRAFGR